MSNDPTVVLVLGGERWRVRRDIALAVLRRSAMLASEGRIEVARLPLEVDPPAVLHLALGAQPIVLFEERAVADPAELLEEPDPPMPLPADVGEVFLDFDAYSSSA